MKSSFGSLTSSTSSQQAGSPSCRELLQSYLTEEECMPILSSLQAEHSLLHGMLKEFLNECGVSPTSQAVAMHSQQVKRPRDTEMLLKVTLEELYMGCTKQVTVPRTRHDALTGCRVGYQECLQVQVQPGVKEGTRITLPGLGGERGCSDLTLVIQQQLHPSFRRLADDLYVLVSVPLVTALTGGPVQLKTLSGQLLQLPVDDNAVIAPGTELVVPDQGMPVFGDLSGRRGALHVKFKVNFPQHLSQQQQLLLRHALAGCEFPPLVQQAEPERPQLLGQSLYSPQERVPQGQVVEEEGAEEQPQLAQRQQQGWQQHLRQQQHVQVASNSHHQAFAFASGSVASSSSCFASVGVSSAGHQVCSHSSGVAGYACVNSSASSRQVGTCSNGLSAAAAAATTAAVPGHKDEQQLQQGGGAGQPTYLVSSHTTSHASYSTTTRW